MALKMKNKAAVMRKPIRVILAGVAGVGKSTAFGTVAKKALVIDLDKRWPKSLVEKADFADVAESFRGIKDFLNEVLAEPKIENDWLVFDTATKLMALVEAWVVQQDCSGSKDKYNAYGHGLRFAPQYMQELLDIVDKIQEKHQINVAFICHSKMKSYKNPVGDDYVKNVLDLPEIVADRLKQWCDCLGMCFFDVVVDKEKRKIVGASKRVVTFMDNPIHEAKAGLAWALPEKIDLDIGGRWGQLAFTGAYDENRDMVAQIDALIESYPANQKAEIRAKFETISYRTLPAKTLQEYIAAAKTAKGEGK